MAWLDDILGAAAQQRNALTLAAAQQGQASATGTTASSTGGTEYPGTTSAAAAASPQAQFDAAKSDYLAGYNLRAKKGKYENGKDALGRLAQLVRDPQAQQATGDPFASVLQLNQRAGSPRGGQAYQELRLGDAVFHVYIDKNGKRQVFKFAQPPAGG